MTTIRKLLFLLAISCISTDIYSQIGAVVAADKQNIVYTGIDNPISIAVPGYRCEQTYAATDNGILSGDGCHYIARPVKAGEATITVFAINTIDSLFDTVPAFITTFRVKNLPDPVVRISGLRNENITKGVLMAQKGPYAVLEGFDIEAKYKITSFWVRHYSSNSKYREVYNEGTLFNGDTLEMFNNAFNGDIFRFFGIHATTPDGREIELEPIELYVKNKY